MTRLALLTEDETLRDELGGVLPGGKRLLRKPPAGGGCIVFYDLDTLQPKGMERLSESCLVVALTKRKSAEPAIDAATHGAFEILQRPLKEGPLLRLLDELDEYIEEISETVRVKGIQPTPTCAIVGYSRGVIEVCKKLALLSQSEAPVLITGETGTGKELVAESIAQLSERFGKPFVVVNCASVPDALLESELFGHVKGAFTGAVATKEGLLKIADEGCVFFDEVGEIPLSLQGKLLRFLQTQTFYPVGGTREEQVDVRVISATNRDLAAMVRQGRFREDLYFRLHVTSIHVPPLRERKKDISPLVNFFVDRYRHTARRSIHGMTRAFMSTLRSYGWPGNIRELENAVRSAIALSRSNYLSTHELRGLGEHSFSRDAASAEERFASVVVPYAREALGRGEPDIYEKVHALVDRSLIEYVVGRTKENYSEAARMLGINRLTLRKKLRR